jgi:hypothetical protein
MKIDNPPSPPFRKGGMGGFESYFLGNLVIEIYLVIGIW